MCAAAASARASGTLPATPAPAPRQYEDSMRLRHAEVLAAVIAAGPGPARTTTARRTIARFMADAYAPAREADDPDAAVDETFLMIEAAWKATRPSRDADGPRTA